MAKKKTYTHTGIFHGADGRTPKDFKRRAVLRETKKYWITSLGKRFSKNFGSGPGQWPLYRLDLDTIEKLDKPIVLEEG